MTASSVTLSWTPPTNTYGVASYVLYRNGVAVAAPTGTTFTDIGLNANTTYTYTVATRDTAGTLSPLSKAYAASTAGSTAAAWTQAPLAYNRVGFVANAATFGGGLDGYDYAYSANLLGRNLAFGGANFAFGTAGVNNVTSAAGQTVSLPQAKAATLAVLAAGINGAQANQAFTIRYADGTTQTATLSISDWANPQNYAGEAKALTMAYRNAANGTQQSLSVYVYGYTIALNTAKAVASVTLPNNANVNLLGISVYNASSTALAPPAPANLAAASLVSSQVRLTWSQVASATTLTLQRSTDGTTFTTVSSAIGPTAIGYTDTDLAANTTYTYRLLATNAAGTSPASGVASATTFVANLAPTKLSGPNWTSANSGYGTAKNDTSVTGNTIKLRGTGYAIGIGVNADSTVAYDLAGRYTAFAGTIGIDDAVPTYVNPGVTFQIYGDGKLLFDSGAVGRTSDAVLFSVNVAGVKTLTLVAATTTPGNVDYCQADWAGVTLLAAPTAPNEPTKVIATPGATTPAGVASVGVVWQAGGAQTGFVLQRSTDGKMFTTLVTLPGTTLAYTNTTVAGGATYLYRVLAVNAYGTSAPSVADDATTQKYQAPATSTGLKATATTSSSVSLAWNVVAGVNGYVVYRNGISLAMLNGATTTAFTDGSVAGLPGYWYTVASFDAFGATSPQSSPLAITTPASWTQAALTFNRVGITDNGVKFTGGFDGTGYAFSAAQFGGSLSYNGVSFVLGPTGANNVLNAAGQTVTLPQLEGTSLAILAAAGTANQANQTFVIRCSDGTTQNVALSISGWASSSQNFAGETKVFTAAYRNAADGTQQAGAFSVYGYTIALNGAKTVTGITLPNNGNVNVFAIGVSTTVVTTPNAPTGLAASAASATQVDLSWAAATGPTITGYVLQRSTDGTNYADVATIAATTTSYADTGLTAGTTYGYRVVAVNAAGRSAASNVASARLVASVATALTDLTWKSATSGWQTAQKDRNVKGTTITLRGKTYAKGIGVNADGTVTYDLAGGGYTRFPSDIGVDDAAGGRGSVVFQVVGDGRVLFTSATLTGISAAASIDVDVTGVKTLQLVATHAGDGIDYDQADWANPTLYAPADTAPAAPTNLTALAAIDGRVRLAWSNASETATFRVQRSTGGGQTFVTVADNLPAGTVVYLDAAAHPGASYTYRILAVNGATVSTPSVTATVKTVAANAVATNLSTRSWTSATSGWKTVQKDASVAGKFLSLRGTTYATGLGKHASSQIVYDLSGGTYTRFQSDVGIDDGVAVGGRVVFRVYGDGKLLFDSGVVTQASAAVSIDLNVAGVRTLTLVAEPAIAGDIDYAHADWAGARLIA